MPSTMDQIVGPQIVAEHEPLITTCVGNIERKYNEQIDPLTYDLFSDERFYRALPDEYKVDNLGLENLMLHTSRFKRLISLEMVKRQNGDMSGLFGEEVEIPETTHADGRVRRAESGYRINVEYVRSRNIDPKKILFFRKTQPSDSPKPEWYWTTDYFEAQRGLSREIPEEQRAKSVKLVSTLEEINNNGGLIMDVNDDSGLSVRQILPRPFDQKDALAIIK
jgi:hypothetical protein